jgi:proteasome lid subunit RPN8/RPN11
MENNHIDELILTHSIYGDNVSSIYMESMPFDKSVIGSAHSHPSNSNKPSGEDIHSFPKFGKIHLIIALPFNMDDIKMFDVRGKEINFRVIE